MERQIKFNFSKVRKSNDWCYDYGANIIDVRLTITDANGVHEINAGYLERRLGYEFGTYDYLIGMGQTDLSDYVGKEAWDQIVGQEDNWMDIGYAAKDAREGCRTELLQFFKDADQINEKRAREAMPDDIDRCPKCDGYQLPVECGD